MAEVEGIVLFSLREIGVPLGDDIMSLAQFETKHFVHATAACLQAISDAANPDGGGRTFPTRLPAEMSGRFRICSNLARAVTDLGYSKDTGYNSWLYPDPPTTRDILLFLVEKLPKTEDAAAAADAAGGAATGDALWPAVAARLTALRRAPWLPSALATGVAASQLARRPGRTLRTAVTAVPSRASLTPRERAWAGAQQRPVTAQPRAARDVPTAVLEANAAGCARRAAWEREWERDGLDSGLGEAEYRRRKGRRVERFVGTIMAGAAAALAAEDRLAGELDDDAGDRRARGTRFTHHTDFAQESADVGTPTEDREARERELLAARAAEIAELEARLQELRATMTQLDIELKAYANNARQIEQQMAGIDGETAGLEDTYKLRKHTLGLLPDADRNMEELRRLSGASAQRLMQLAEEWEEHRVPLLRDIRAEQHGFSARRDAARTKMDEVRAMRERMKALQGEIRSKEERIAALAKEYDRMPKDINRSLYTRRILEIIKNIRKQKVDIEKILIDMRALRKEINNVSATLARSFAVTDEMIFKEARKDKGSQPAKQAYKLLARLNDVFSQLNRVVEETGGVVNAAKDLESSVERMRLSDFGSKLEKIQNDFGEIKNDNKKLMKQLRKKGIEPALE